jgi:hypothetical protein
LLVEFPVGLAWVLGALALGAATQKVALLHGLGILSLPLLSRWLGEPALITQMNIMLAVLMILKRLEANQGRHALRPDHPQVWLQRLLHDRDRY